MLPTIFLLFYLFRCFYSTIENALLGILKISICTRYSPISCTLILLYMQQKNLLILDIQILHLRVTVLLMGAKVIKLCLPNYSRSVKIQLKYIYSYALVDVKRLTQKKHNFVLIQIGQQLIWVRYFCLKQQLLPLKIQLNLNQKLASTNLNFDFRMCFNLNSKHTSTCRCLNACVCLASPPRPAARVSPGAQTMSTRFAKHSVLVCPFANAD